MCVSYIHIIGIVLISGWLQGPHMYSINEKPKCENGRAAVFDARMSCCIQGNPISPSCHALRLPDRLIGGMYLLEVQIIAE